MSKKIYVYNEGTKTLHISGFCKDTSPVEKKVFETENEAVNYAGMYIHMCASCDKKRDEIIKAHIAEKEKK